MAKICELCGATSTIPDTHPTAQYLWDRHECPEYFTRMVRGARCSICGSAWYEEWENNRCVADGCGNEDCPNCLQAVWEGCDEQVG